MGITFNPWKHILVSLELLHINKHLFGKIVREEQSDNEKPEPAAQDKPE